MKESTKTIIRRAGWITTGAGVVALLAAGVSASEINSGVALIDVAVSAVGAVVVFIAGKLKTSAGE